MTFQVEVDAASARSSQAACAAPRIADSSVSAACRFVELAPRYERMSSAKISSMGPWRHAR